MNDLQSARDLDIIALLREHSKPGWDGYGALPVSANSLHKAHGFIQILPLSIPLPEIEVDPDGEVSFDWYNDSGGVFSVSISETGRLAFAGAFDRRKVHGVEYFDDKIPVSILMYLQQMYPVDIVQPIVYTDAVT